MLDTPAPDAHLLELSAFAEAPGGGNPAGVWIGDVMPSDDVMLREAARLGHSETAFVVPKSGAEKTVRYFSPAAEVPFCGHATIASGVALGRLSGPGTYRFNTRAGLVELEVESVEGQWRAAFVSVSTSHEPVPQALLETALGILGWSANDLDETLPPAIAFAGARHLVLATKTEARLDDLEYDFEAFKTLHESADLTTAQLVWRKADDLFLSRNPFPVGGVVEDPATGAAAAALGGYLRDAGFISAPKSMVIHQGGQIGRPSVLHVDIPATGGIRISGSAVDFVRSA